MVEIWVNGEALDLFDTPFKFTEQVSDITELGTVKTSYSDAYKLPFTEKNTRILGYLGMVGSTSEAPYLRVECIVKFVGLSIVKNGWLSVISTSTDGYNIAIFSGIVDFFKQIENTNIADFIDLSYLNHEKDLTTVINSFTREDYRYIIANYGGNTLIDGSKVNIDFLTPSTKVSFIWQKIFEKAGWTYSGSIFSNPDFSESWITYPNIAPEGEYELRSSFTKTAFREYREVDRLSFKGHLFWNNFTILDPIVTVNGLWELQVNRTASVRVIVKGNAYMDKGVPPDVERKPIEYFIQIGGQSYSYMVDGTTDPLIVDVNLSQGDTIFLEYYRDTDFSYDLTELIHTSSIIEIYELGTQFVRFEDRFLDFEVKDFVKDQMMRFGLTPIINSETRHIEFITQDEKANIGNYDDWTSKYIGRTNETYLFGSYAQQNLFKHKYNNEEPPIFDGKLLIDNVNIEASKTLYESKIYARSNSLFEFALTLTRKINTFVYPFFESEAKEEAGVVSVSYKALNGRYYIIKSQNQTGIELTLKTVLGDEEQTVTSAPFAYSGNTEFAELIPLYYQVYINILDLCRIHTIKVKLNIVDFNNLDLNKLKYFEQEASFYILNNITIDEKGNATGEFIKFKTL